MLNEMYDKVVVLRINILFDLLFVYAIDTKQ